VLQRIDAAAARLCGDCSALPALQVPGDMQVTADVQKAMKRARISPTDNSHPATAVDLPASKPAKAPLTQGDTGGRGGTDGTADEGTTSGGGLELPNLGGDGKDTEVKLPKDPKDLLGAVDDATGGLLGSVTDTTGKVLPGELGKVTDGLVD
jgi:hypothetical protein